MSTRRNVAGVHAEQLELNSWVERCLRSEASAKEHDNRSWAVAGMSDEAIRIRITRWTGSQSDGFVFAACEAVIRVAVPGSGDAEQFSCRDGHWYTEGGDSVEIEFF